MDKQFTDNKIIEELNSADLFLRNRAKAKPAPLNEYDIELLFDIAKVCCEAANLIETKNAEIERLKENYNKAMDNLKAVLEERADHSEAIKDYENRLFKRMRENNDCLYLDDIVEISNEMVGEINGNTKNET